MLRRLWFELLAACGFAALRVVTFMSLPAPVAFYDSLEYRAIPEGPDWPYVSLVGNSVRPPTVPVFYALVGEDHRRAFGQLVVAVVCWLVAAFAFRATVDNPWVRRAAFCVPLLFGLTIGITNWDRLLLSESLTCSLAVLCVASWLAFLRRPGHLPRQVFVAVAMLLFVGARPHVLPLVLALAVAVGVWARWPDARRAKLTVAAALVAIGAWGFVIVPRVETTSAIRPEGVGQFSQNFILVLQIRILPDPEALAWFQEQGMPPPTGLGPPRPGDGGIKGLLQVYDHNDGLYEWVETQGSTALLRYSITHPEKFPARFLSEVPDLLSPPYRSVVYADVATVLPRPVESFLMPTKETWDIGSSPLLVLVVATSGVLLLRRRRPVARGPLAVVVGVQAFSWGAVFTSWLVSPMEPERHAIPFSFLIPMTLVLGTLLVVDAIVPPRSNLTDRSS